MGSLARLVNTGFALGYDSLQSFIFGEREKVLSVVLNVAANLDSRNRSNDLLQPVTALQHGLGGEIPAVTPKHVEEVKDNRCSWAFLPLLEQLKSRDTLRVERNNFAVENG